MTQLVVLVDYVGKNIVNLRIPHLEVDHYPIYRNDDESDADLRHRVNLYADELIKRHDAGEPYAIGYREWSDGKVRLVVRKVEGEKILERVIGLDDDFRAI